MGRWVTHNLRDVYKDRETRWLKHVKERRTGDGLVASFVILFCYSTTPRMERSWSICKDRHCI